MCVCVHKHIAYKIITSEGNLYNEKIYIYIYEYIRFPGCTDCHPSHQG